MFRRLDYALWRATAHNPVQMLQRVSAERLNAAAADPSFVKAYDEAIFGLDTSVGDLTVGDWLERWLTDEAAKTVRGRARTAASAILRRNAVME